MRLIYNHRHFPILSVVITVTIVFIIIPFYYSLHPTAIRISPLYWSFCSYSFNIRYNQIIFDNESYSIHHYPEFICPQNFRNLADWVYGWPDNVFNERLENYFDQHKSIVSNLPDGSIIYVKTNYVSNFFSNIYPLLQNRVVLITSQGDDQAPNPYLHYLDRSDSKILHWFGQNGNINATRSNRFTHIPIGINCFEMAEGLRDVHREYHNSTLSSISHQSVDEPPHYIQPFDISQRILHNKHHFNKLLLLNFNPETDLSGTRTKLWQNLCANNSQLFAICLEKPGGVNISSLPAIYRRNRQYPLWLSPRGGGLDCHRTWEALYLDIIPVVWHSTLDALYENLPIIVIKDSNEINEQFLREKLREISMKKMQQPPVYQYEKLRNAYWRDLIMSKSRYNPTVKDINRKRCWRARTVP